MKFKLDLSNNATKSDLKNVTGVNSSKLVDELVIDKLKTVPVDAVVNVIGISGFLLKTQFNTNKSGLEKKNNDTGKKTKNKTKTKSKKQKKTDTSELVKKKTMQRY